MKSNKSKPERKRQNPSTNSSTSYKVFPTTNFINQAKRLKKKYPNIKDDFFLLYKELRKDPMRGNDALGKECYKVRMNITDKNVGESGGARIIIQVKIIDKKVYVLSVYDKSEKKDLLENELDKILKKKLQQFKE